MHRSTAVRSKKPKTTTKRANVEAPIPFRPTPAPQDAPSPQWDGITCGEADCACAHPVMRDSRGDAIFEPGTGGAGAQQHRTLAQLRAERQALAHERTPDDNYRTYDHRASLGTLLADKIGAGHVDDRGNGRGIVEGAMMTICAGLEVVRAALDNDDGDNMAGTDISRLLYGLKLLGELAVEVGDRTVEAREAVALAKDGAA